MSDADVISACLRRDPAAQQRLYEAYLPYVLTVVRRYGFAAHEEPDCVQEIFIEVFASLRHYQANKGTLKTWIRTVGVRRLLKLKRGHDKVSTTLAEAPEAYTQASVNYAHFDTEYLLTAIAQLPPGYCIIFNLFEVDGYSHAEIAEALDISEASSRSQLSRAKERLRQTLCPQTLCPQALKHAG